MTPTFYPSKQTNSTLYDSIRALIKTVSIVLFLVQHDLNIFDIPFQEASCFISGIFECMERVLLGGIVMAIQMFYSNDHG